MPKRLRGDTIIEVILAVTVFSAVAIGAMTIMNSGISITQTSLEVTLARQQIDAQAEMLRYVYDRKGDQDSHYVNLWNNIETNHIVANPLNMVGIDSCPASIARGFVFRPASGLIGMSTNYTSQPATFAKLEGGQAQGLSLQVTRVTGDGHSVGAFDVYIQSCWHAPSGSRPVTIGTIVRLYDAG